MKSDGYYEIISGPSASGSLVLDVHNAGTANGTPMKRFTRNSSDAQRFAFIASESGTYRIVPKNATNKVLDVRGPSTADNTQIQLWDWASVNQQRWVLEKANTQGYAPTSSYPTIRVNGQWYFNYNVPVNKMLDKTFAEAEAKSLLTSSQYALIVGGGSLVFGPIFGITYGSGMYAGYQANCFVWFFNQVNHNAPWDIKEGPQWNTQMSAVGQTAPYLGKTFNFYYQGSLMNAADMGNYMYGYCGRAMGLGANIIYWGGGVAHVRNTHPTYKQYGTLRGYALAMLDSQTQSYPYGDLPEDTVMIGKGISAFNQKYPNYKTVISNPPTNATTLFNNIYDLFYNN
ncbi:MAG: RICIN domain-containing protein [Oscillospiraceae bacterium]|nr:RICIN domain-containing protein [Oscillospiraceae bacterium]